MNILLLLLVLLLAKQLFSLWLQFSKQHVLFHSQNLSDGRKHIIRCGRCWWSINPNEKKGWENRPYGSFLSVNMEWEIFTRDRGFTIGFHIAGEEFDLKFGLRLPFLGSIYLTLQGVPFLWELLKHHRMGFGYETSVKFAGGSLWISVIYNDTWGTQTTWKNSPRWISLWIPSEYKDYPRVGFDLSVSIDDILLGSRQHDQKNLWDEFKSAEIPMEPDNSHGYHYIGQFMLEEHRWWRSYFPRHKRVHRYVDIRVDEPPMHAGKGENSYDLDDDGIFGMGVPCETVEEAIKGYQEAVDRNRKKYGFPSHISEKM